MATKVLTNEIEGVHGSVGGQTVDVEAPEGGPGSKPVHQHEGHPVRLGVASVGEYLLPSGRNHRPDVNELALAKAFDPWGGNVVVVVVINRAFNCFKGEMKSTEKELARKSWLEGFRPRKVKGKIKIEKDRK